MGNKKIEVDISGQIQQLNYDSALGFRRNNGIEKSVFLRSKDKKEIMKKYRGQVMNLVEKLHCILIYYLIKDEVRVVDRVTNLIMPCFKVRDIHTAPPGNPYNKINNYRYINFR